MHETNTFTKNYFVWIENIHNELVNAWADLVESYTFGSERTLFLLFFYNPFNNVRDNFFGRGVESVHAKSTSSKIRRGLFA